MRGKAEGEVSGWDSFARIAFRWFGGAIYRNRRRASRSFSYLITYWLAPQPATSGLGKLQCRELPGETFECVCASFLQKTSKAVTESHGA